MKNKTKKPKFVRKDTFKKSRIGKRRKKKQKWRRARGRDNKIREKRKGYRKKPLIGYGAPKSQLKNKLVYSARELDQIKKDEIIIVGKVGKKRKIEIAKKAVEKNIKLSNLNTKKFLEKIKKEQEKKKEEKKKARKEEKKKKEEKKLKTKTEEKTLEKKEKEKKEETKDKEEKDKIVKENKEKEIK